MSGATLGGVVRNLIAAAQEVVAAHKAVKSMEESGERPPVDEERALYERLDIAVYRLENFSGV